MKKIISIILVFMLLILPSAVFASAEDFNSNVSGFSNVEFANGYYGFCIDADLKGAEEGDVFTAADSTDVATNNVDSSNVSQKLKLLLVLHFEELFVYDGNGGYVVDSLKASSSVQTAIWNITDNRYNYGEGKKYVEKINAYDGPEIPDEGYTLTLSSGETVVFSFAVVDPPRDNQQSFFCYKVVVANDESEHKHDYSDEWSTDEKNHWHECECTDKTDLDEHTFSDATCINPSICTVCNKQISGVNSDNHVGETYTLNAKPATEFEDGYTGDIYCSDCDTLIEKGETIPATHKHDYSDEWSTDEKNHWHECECNDKTDNAAHSYKDGVCTVCGEKSASDYNTPSIDLDSILGALPEIDLDGIIDTIIGIIGGIDFDGGNNNGNNNGENNGNNIDTEIPDTGSDASVVFIFAIAAISLISIIYIRKKKVCIE